MEMYDFAGRRVGMVSRTTGREEKDQQGEQKNWMGLLSPNPSPPEEARGVSVDEARCRGQGDHN